jgi:tRNA(Ile)-lysidine synthase TilS/MesJ
MICDVCGGRAVFTRRERSLVHVTESSKRFCAKCFSDWIRERVAQNISSNTMLQDGDRVLACVSGEKDSTVMLHLLDDYARSNGIGAEVFVLSVDEGIGDYRTRCVELVRQHAERRGRDFIDRNFADEHGATLDVIFGARPSDGYRMCMYCCTLRGKTVVDVARKLGVNKIATGLNLNDAVEHAVMCLMKGVIDDQSLPVHVPPGSPVSFISPIFNLSGLECGLFAYVNSIEVLNEDCRYCGEHLRDDISRSLNLLEDANPGILLSLYEGYAALARAGQPSSPVLAAAE